MLAWFVYGWLSLILFTDFIRWALWEAFAVPLHYLVSEGTLLSILSLGIGIVRVNTFGEFFPALISVSRLLVTLWIEAIALCPLVGHRLRRQRLQRSVCQIGPIGANRAQ